MWASTVPISHLLVQAGLLSAEIGVLVAEVAGGALVFVRATFLDPACILFMTTERSRTPFSATMLAGYRYTTSALWEKQVLTIGEINILLYDYVVKRVIQDETGILPEEQILISTGCEVTLLVEQNGVGRLCLEVDLKVRSRVEQHVPLENVYVGSVLLAGFDGDLDWQPVALRAVSRSWLHAANVCYPI